jgi:hypothetical protein
MNPSNAAVKKTDWRFTGVVLLSVAIGVGAAAAAIFQHGDSTTTIEQSGGQGTSHSQVTRDKDGQTIITHDGSSTDITVQRRSGAPAPDDGSEDPAPKARETFKQRMLERMHRPAP